MTAGAVVLVLGGCATPADRLLLGAEAGNIANVRAGLAAGVSPDYAPGVGLVRRGTSAHLTPLMFAARRGDIAMMQLLLESGAAVDKATTTKVTALHGAVVTKQLAAARLLLQAGANPNATTTDGETPVYLASLSQKDLVALLLAQEADANIANDKGITPLHRAAIKGGREIAELLLQHGARLDAEDKYQNTPLILAAYVGNRETVAWLLDRGANAMARNCDGQTPLHTLPAFPESNRAEIAALLIARGADPNARDKNHRIPSECWHQEQTASVGTPSVHFWDYWQMQDYYTRRIQNGWRGY